MLKEMRTVTITSKGQIAIPKELRKTKGFEIGSKVAILAFDNRVELRPLSHVNEKLFPSLASEKALSKEWNTKKEDKAWKHLQKEM